MAEFDGAAERLLDFSKPFDVPLLDSLLSSAYSPSSPSRPHANSLLMQIQTSPNLYTISNQIIDTSPNMITKFFGLQIMEEAIRTRWGIMSEDTREGIKSYIINMVIQRSSEIPDDATMKRLTLPLRAKQKENQVFLGKLNMVLISILKHDWPHNWPRFISDLVNSSRSNEMICSNNMSILKLLSEEVFDFSRDSLTTDKVKSLKESLNTDFTLINNLCELVLEHSTSEPLIHVTLQTLQRFLTWIPLHFVFQTSLIFTLLNKFFADPVYRNDALDCLTEIASLSNIGPVYDTLFQNLYIGFITRLKNIFPPTQDLSSIWTSQTSATSETDQLFLHRLSLFLTAFFKNHLSTVESPELEVLRVEGMFYLVRVSEVPDNEVFKICLEYWHELSNELYLADRPVPAANSNRIGGGGGGLKLNTSGVNGNNDDEANDIDDANNSPPSSPTNNSHSHSTQHARQGSIPGQGQGHAKAGFVGNEHNGTRRKAGYLTILSSVRQCLISRMAKPEEVLIVEDENGDIVRETTKDTDVIAQYKTMKETLVYLTNLDCDDTENIMLQRLSLQVSGAEWSWNNLNTLCWAIGSISGAMSEEEEKRFLVTVIKDLLGLCELKKGKDNKAVVASNIMYVVGQYPRFLKAHWKFLKTVVNKLFEFMHEIHPGVQDMACDTFLKIAMKCKRKFVTLQPSEKVPFICELVETLPNIITDLEAHQVQAFYEAVGYMLSDRGAPSSSSSSANGISSNNSSSNGVAIDRVGLLLKLMELPNQAWRVIMDKAGSSGGASLMETGTMKEVVKILKSNTRVCHTIGPLFMNQLNVLFLDSLQMYKLYSEEISKEVQTKGPAATKLSHVRAMRSCKKEVLRLLSTFVEKSGEPECGPDHIARGFLPPILDPILGDYSRNIAGARDPEVLGLFTTVVEKLKANVIHEVPRIMGAIFECTLQMITANYEDYPEHRIKFFMFLKAVVNNCFPALFQIPPEHQKYTVDSIVWAFKHTERNISETGLDILYELLVKVYGTTEIKQGFYQQFLLYLITEILAVMTDRMHKSGFKQHVTLLRHMFHLVENKDVTIALYDVQTPDPYGGSNKNYLSSMVSEMLVGSFPNMTRNQIKLFIDGLFDVKLDVNELKTHLRDFLVQLREFSVEDNAGLYQEEADENARRALEEDKVRRTAIPGMIKPSELEMDDDL